MRGGSKTRWRPAIISASKITCLKAASSGCSPSRSNRRDNTCSGYEPASKRGGGTDVPPPLIIAACRPDQTLFARGLDFLFFVLVHFLDGRIRVGFAGGLGRRRRRAGVWNRGLRRRRFRRSCGCGV